LDPLVHCGVVSNGDLKGENCGTNASDGIYILNGGSTGTGSSRAINKDLKKEGCSKKITRKSKSPFQNIPLP
jgi:hypothetical protein